MVRELFAISVVMLLIGFGWKQPFERHYQHVLGIAPQSTPIPNAAGHKASATQPQATVPPVRRSDNSWMWRETSMQKPYNQTRQHD